MIAISEFPGRFSGRQSSGRRFAALASPRTINGHASDRFAYGRDALDHRTKLRRAGWQVSAALRGHAIRLVAAFLAGDVLIVENHSLAIVTVVLNAAELLDPIAVQPHADRQSQGVQELAIQLLQE